MRPRLAFLVFLTALAFPLYFHRSSAIGLLGPDEPRYAQVAREMLRSGDWITPHLMGNPWFEKPPLYYWMAAACFKLFGVNETAARLPAALCALAFLLLFAWQTQRLFPGEAILYATLLLACSAGWIGFGRAASMEMLFAASLAGALGFLALWVWAGRRRFLFAFHGLLALSVLAKGLGGVALAALILAAYSVITREWRWLWKVLHPGALLLFAVVALPWYGAMLFKHGALFFDDFIVKHHFRRFLTAELAHPGPWWFYAPVVLAGLFPWTTHLALLRPAELARDNRRLFLAVWAGVVIVFFSVSQGKLPGYLLPAFPALAMWMGEEWRRASIIRLRAVAVAQGLLLLLLSLADSLPSILARGLRRAELQFSAGGVCFALGSVVLVWMAWRGRRLGAAVLAGVLTAVALVWIVHTVAPGVDAANSMRGVARQVCGKPFAVWEVRRQVRYGLEFYCDRPMTEAVAADLVLSTQHPPGMTREQEFQEARLSLWKR